MIAEGLTREIELTRKSKNPAKGSRPKGTGGRPASYVSDEEKMRKRQENRRKKTIKMVLAKLLFYSSNEKERIELRATEITPSDAWREHCCNEAEAQGLRATVNSAVWSQLESYEIFPPRAENSPMKACICERCGGIKLWPRSYFVSSHDVSFECYIEGIPLMEIIHHPSSPGIVDIRRTNRGDIPAE